MAEPSMAPKSKPKRGHPHKNHLPQKIKVDTLNVILLNFSINMEII